MTMAERMWRPRLQSGINRRDLLKVGGAGVAGAALATRQPRRSRAQDEPVTISWATWGGAAQAQLYTEAISQFQSQQDTIRVENRNTPSFGDHAQRILTTVAGGDAPDVIMMGGEWIATYADQGVYVPLETFIEGDTEFSLDAYFQNTLDGMRYNDQLWALPKDFNVNVLYYNVNHFDEAGLEYPTPEWTWDDFLSAAQALTVRDGARVERYGATDASQTNPYAWIWQNEGESFDQSINPSEVLLTEPNALEAQEFYFGLASEHGVVPPPADLEQAGGRQELFLAGRVSMLLDHRGPVVPLRAAEEDGSLDFEWAMTQLPQGDVRATQLLYAGYSITAASEVQEAAWEFLKWVSGPEGVPIFISGGNALPALTALSEDPSFAVEEALQASVEYARFLVSTPHWGEISSPITDNFELVALGEQTVQEGAEAIKAEVDPILQS